MVLVLSFAGRRCGGGYYRNGFNLQHSIEEELPSRSQTRARPNYELRGCGEFQTLARGLDQSGAAWAASPTMRSYAKGEIVMPSLSALRRSLLIAALVGIPAMALSETAAPPGASVYIISPKDGDTVSSPFKVQFGLTGMGIAPAGIEKPKTGHHHLIIDATLSAEELKQPIAGDAKHVHFGGGQTEAMVTLPPGQHTLQLVLGDWSHVPFDPPIMSAVVTVTVK
jgi:hypothetical protein